MDRFFVGEDQIIDGKIRIVGEDVKHISGPLRLEPGHKLEVVSQGTRYLAQIDQMDKEEVILTILERERAENEPRIKISLYQGLPKGEKAEYIVQKCTELGVTDFNFVSMERSIVKIRDDKKKKKRLERLQKIADEAAKQSKRDILPRVEDIIGFRAMLEKLKGEKNILVPYEDENPDRSLRSLIREIDEDSRVNIIIGPEGGFSREEIEEIKSIGGRSLSLGPRIFRTETAGLVASAVILYEFGDM